MAIQSRMLCLFRSSAVLFSSALLVNCAAPADSTASYEEEIDVDGGSTDVDELDAISVAELMPMAVGSRFEYAFVASGCGPGSKVNMEVLNIDESDGAEIFEIESVATCNSYGTPYVLDPELSLQSIKDQDVHWKLDSTQTWRRIMNAPIEEGRAFETGIVSANQPETFRWSKVAEVSVPAGDFVDCWQTLSTVATIVDERVYCPGVGLVRRSLHSENGLTGMTIEQLVSYEL